MSTKTKKAKAKPKSTSSSRLATQAASEAFLRTNPERSTLAQQLADAKGDRDTSVAASRTAANANVAAAAKAPAANQKVYDDAVARVGAAVAAPGVDNPTTGAGRDAAQTRGHLAAMLAAANDDATSRQLSAREGDQYAVGKANSTYAGTAGTLNARLRALAQEEGVFTQGRVADLTGERTKLNHDSAQKAADRRSREGIAAAGDETTIKAAKIRTAASEKSKRKVKWQSPAQAGRLKDSVESLKSWIRQNKADYAKEAGGDAKKLRALMAQDLSVGVSGQSFVDPTTGAINKDPGVPKAGSDLALKIALDMALDGHVSAANVARLHQRRYKVGDLGYPLGSGKKTTPATLSSSERAPGGT